MYITPTDAGSTHGDSRTIGIYTNDDSLVTIESGVFNVGLRVCLTTYTDPAICDEFPFTVEILTSLLSYEPEEMWNFDGTPANALTRKYPMGSGPMVIAEIPYDLQQQATCKNTVLHPCGEYNERVTG